MYSKYVLIKHLNLNNYTIFICYYTLYINGKEYMNTNDNVKLKCDAEDKTVHCKPHHPERAVILQRSDCVCEQQVCLLCY